MCGIVGYKGKKGENVIINGLKSLEYRGYDSWGISTISNQKLITQKQTGRIGEYIGNCKKQAIISIGHTRWATTGKVNQENAHPHLSNNNKISVVHNGIIENYHKLRAKLVKKGFAFKSQTDTEIIPNLIENLMNEGQSFEEAFKQTLNKLDGTYAIVAINSESKKILFGKHISPLVLGIGENEYFIASDAPAFMKHTRKVIFLEDGDSGEINSELKLFDKNGKETKREIQELTWTIEEAQKGKYPHFMLKEINEQKHTIEKAIKQNPKLIDSVVEAIKNAHGIFFVACGTSNHASLVASYLFSHIAKKHVNVVLASEFSNYQEFLTDKTLIIAVSQSGETADLIDAVKTAKEKGSKIISIVNVMGSTLMRIADKSIIMNAGPEICVLSTKSYTSQIAILTLLAYAVAGKKEEAIEKIKHCSKYVENVLTVNEEKLKKLANSFKDKKDIFVIGRDVAYPTALEAALKIKEVSYIHAEGFAGGELKHGTIALIEEGVPAFVFVTEKTRAQVISNAEEIKARGGIVIGIDSISDPVFDIFLQIPKNNPLLMIIPLQLFAYYLALERGCDPDKPRNLAKSVTVR